MILPNSQYYKQKGGLVSNKTGDLSVPRPILQANNNSNNNNATSSAFKITQVGQVIGSNVIVSRMDGSNMTRPTSSSPIPISGPLAANNNYHYFNNGTGSKAQVPRPLNSSNNNSNSSNTKNFYHATANNVTKFTNMTVANVGAKNPLKPTHYTVPIASNSAVNNSNGATNPIVNLATHPNSNLSAPNTSGIAPKTTLKASDLIHILPNLFNTLKRRNSNSSASGTSANSIGKGSTNNGSGTSGYFNSGNTNSLAAAVVAAASNSGKPLTTSTAAVLVAEQLLNAAASGPFSDDSSPSPPPPQHQNQPQHSKRIKLHDPSSLQCEVCGKSYKHRNCLSKHMWEHHESWEHTKKVCQTKHQQVQLLEAAQVLSEIISGVRSSRNSSSSEGEEDSGGEQQINDESDGEEIEDGIREMAIVPDEDENISIGN